MAAKTKYKWSQWFDLPRFQLVYGVDFSCSISSMQQQIRNKAAKMGKNVSIRELRKEVNKKEIIFLDVDVIKE